MYISLPYHLNRRSAIADVTQWTTVENGNRYTLRGDIHNMLLQHVRDEADHIATMQPSRLDFGSPNSETNHDDELLGVEDMNNLELSLHHALEWKQKVTKTCHFTSLLSQNTV